MNGQLYHAFQEYGRNFLWSGYRLKGWEVSAGVATVFERQLIGLPERNALQSLTAAGFSEDESLRCLRVAARLCKEDLAAFPETSRPDYYTHAVELEPCFDLANIIVSGACNLRCPYCWNAGGTYQSRRPQLMTREVGRAVARFVADHSAPALTMRFYGGEPLLNEPVMRQLTRDMEEAAATRNTKVRFSVTTNGTLLNAENCAFFQSRDFEVGVSIDGGPDVMGEQRPLTSGGNSHRLVVEGLRAAHEAGIRFSVRLTLTARFAPSWLEHAAHVMGLGIPFESVQVEFVDEAGPFGSPDLEVPLDVCVAALDDYAAYLLAYKRQNGELPRVFLHPFPEAYDTLTAPKYVWRACAAGSSRICIGADGSIYPCVSFSGTPQASMGNVLAPPENLPRFRVPAVGEIQKCEDCFLKYACLGGCLQSMYAANPLLPLPLPESGSGPGSLGLEPPEEFCTLQRHAYRKAIAVLSMTEEWTLPYDVVPQEPSAGLC